MRTISLSRGTVIRGDIDGEEFVIKHESNVQLNSPENNETSFGTYFRLDYPGKLPEKDISLGITKNGDSKFEDVVQVRTYDWYGFDVATQSVGEAFINDITFKGDRTMISATYPTNSNPDNRFEITSITPLELDENLDEIYSGKLYKVEGNFAVTLDKWDNSGKTRRLTVEYFSAIFHDNSL